MVIQVGVKVKHTESLIHSYGDSGQSVSNIQYHVSPFVIVSDSGQRQMHSTIDLFIMAIQLNSSDRVSLISVWSYHDDL